MTAMKPNDSPELADLGINLSLKREPALFRWFLICVLFGKRTSRDFARRASQEVIASGITNLTALAKADWSALGALLEKAHPAGYDYSTATALINAAKAVKEQHGSLTGLLKQSVTEQDLTERLLELPGVGTESVRLFVGAVGPEWFKAALPHDYQAALRAARILQAHGFESYIIGGAVRDLWLGYEPKDFDLVTNALPDQIMAIEEFSQSKYKDPAQAFGVTRVRFTYQAKTHDIEIATFRKDLEAHHGRKATKIAFAELEDDVNRRDFTINALAFDPATRFVTDYVGGIDDLEAGIIRFIGNPSARIQEDPLRLIRAIRFKNRLGFKYHESAARAIQQAANEGQVEKIAVDRLRDELTGMLIHKSRRSALQDLYEFGILDRVLPEVTAGKGVRQPPEFHAEGDVWQHELLIMDYLPEHPSKRLVWAALLHDIGKGPTSRRPRRAGERIRFDRHYAVGAEMAKVALKRLRFSNRDINDITWMIHYHMGIDDLPAMRPSHQQLMLGHPAFEDLLELHRADAAASWRPGVKRGTKPKFREIEQLWHDYLTRSPHRRQPSLKRDLGINGDWLLRHFGTQFNLKAGPVIGEVLDELERWYRDEGIRSQAAYLKKARQLLKKHLG